MIFQVHLKKRSSFGSLPYDKKVEDKGCDTKEDQNVEKILE